MSSSGRVRLLVLGNPLLDISAPVDHAFVEKYDLVEQRGKAILAEPKHEPLYEELVSNYKVEYIAGGAAQNTARIASWLLGAPHTVAYIGCIGADENGKILRTEAEKFGVDIHYLVDQDAPTGTCAVLITDKERTLCTKLGAANNYKIDHIRQPEIHHLVESAEFYYIAGYFLTVSPDTALLVGKHAAAHNKTFLFNLAAPFIIDFFFEPLSALLPYVDVLFSNETEAATFGAKMGWGSDLHEIAKKLGNWEKANASRPRIVVFTQGPRETIVFKSGVSTEIKPIPVARHDIVDTNGAGDSFVGGFLAGFLLGHPSSKCVSAGHYCASEVIKRSGCAVPEKPSYSFS